MTMRAYYPSSLYAKSSNRLQVPGLRSGEKEARIRRKSNSFVLISNEFIRRVEDMERTVLIPTKLLDIELSGDECQEAPQFVVFHGNSNLFQVYNLIKNFKTKLEALALDDESNSCLSPLDVDDSLPLTASQLSTLDSGNWSTRSVNSTNESEEESSSLSCSSDNETGSVSEADYRIKRSLHTAKGLCSFLTELVEVCDYLVGRYCEEFQCDA